MLHKKIVLLGAVTLGLFSSCSSTHYTVKSIQRTRILIDSSFDSNADAEALRFISPYQQKVDSMMSPVVGENSKYIVARRPESELSNLLADIMVWAGKKYNEKPDFGIYNMGGIRSGLAKGKVTYGDILDVAPFENKICFITLTGEKTLELFRQVAGLGGEALSYNVRLVITSDKKLVDVKLNGESIDPARSYRIATIDYLAQGNDHLYAFKSGTDLFAPQGEKDNSRYVIIEYFKELMSKGIVVDPKVEGRVVIK